MGADDMRTAVMKMKKKKKTRQLCLFVLGLFVCKPFPRPSIINPLVFFFFSPSSLLVLCVKEWKKKTHATNSPNLRPTISSVINTS